MHHNLIIKDGDTTKVVKEVLVDGIQFVDEKPRAGSTNPVTSDGVKNAIDGAVGDAAEALQEQIDEIAEKAGSGYIPKGEATVATLNALSGQENGELYTMTDAGTLTDGSLAVVAGDTVAWDEANSVWYKAMDYAPAQYGTDQVKNLPTSITAFRTGDVIPVDGPSGTAKMSKDDLLRVTSENAVNSGVAAPKSVQDELVSMQKNGSAREASYTQEDIFINSSGLWENNGTSKTSFVPVVGGSLISIKALSNSNYAFLTDATFSDGGTPSYCSGYTGRVDVTAGDNKFIAVPSDAKYLAFRCGDVSGLIVWSKYSTFSYYALSKNYVENPASKYINSSGVINNHPNFKLYGKVVRGGECYIYSGTTTGSAVSAVFVDNENNSILALTTGDYSNNAQLIKVPENVQYLWVCSNSVDFWLKKVELKNAIPTEVIDNGNKVYTTENLFKIHQYLNVGEVSEAYSANWIRTDFIPVTEGDSFIYTGRSASYAVCYYDKDLNYTGYGVGSGISNKVTITIPSDVAYVCACASCLVGDAYKFVKIFSVDELTLVNADDKFTIELKSIANYGGQPYFGSRKGYEIHRPLLPNVSDRFYIIPHGNPSGVKSKFEMFATDYTDNSGNYSAENFLLFEDTFHLGANKGGTGAIVKQIFGGKYNGSSLIETSARITFDDAHEWIDIKGNKVAFSRADGQPFWECADNAAAIARGLTEGCIYRTGDVVKIVHS